LPRRGITLSLEGVFIKGLMGVARIKEIVKRGMRIINVIKIKPLYIKNVRKN